ncbi:TetR family transcriptional regulator C-terminal domain-containing protein [Actinocorallia populi]|uniref:TetR family transcriptional regulator C-terminal domain-containing protein n=1 Tax=Actinocorallia populi TaxID=2079200 RepID=UPI000D0931F2
MPGRTARLRRPTRPVRGTRGASRPAHPRRPGGGRLRPDLDAAREADALITLTDGLNLQVLFGRRTPDSAPAVLEERIAALRVP